MKLRLLILLAAALLCWAAPAAGQTIKSLGYNTTNGNIVAATNVTFTNSVGFATNARAATRTNLGLGATNTVTFGIINANAVGVGGENIEATGIIGGGGFYISDQNTTNTNAVFYFDGDATDRLRANARTNLGLGLPALTNTSNVTAMRALAGSTNTNEPYSGTVALTNTNVLTFSNGALLKIQ